jgi:uncharacterized protein YciI
MGSQTRSYLLNCTVDPAKRDLLAGLRAAHLAYIVNNQDKIIYGGVMGPADAPPEAICIAVRADSLVEADAFASTDPYAPAYSSISVSEFQQRIPEKYPGQLAEILGALSADANADAKKTTK